MPPDTFDPIGLLAVLNSHGFGYVVIGGLAATVHGSSLPTTDVDVTPHRTATNLTHLSEDLTALNAPIRASYATEGLRFSHGGASLEDVSVLNLITNHGNLDLVMVPAGGMSYLDLVSRALPIELRSIKSPLATLDDIIASKTAADRPKDREARRFLRELRVRLADPDPESPGFKYTAGLRTSIGTTAADALLSQALQPTPPVCSRLNRPRVHQVGRAPVSPDLHRLADSEGVSNFGTESVQSGQALIGARSRPRRRARELLTTRYTLPSVPGSATDSGRVGLWWWRRNGASLP